MTKEEHAKVLAALMRPFITTYEEQKLWEEACAIMRKEPEPTNPRHPQYVEGFKAGHAAGRLRGRAEKPPHISDAEIFDIAGNYDCGTNGENMEWTFKSQKELLDFSRALLEKAR